MYYRFKLEKGGETAGLFYPLAKWIVSKESGLYELVPRYFETLPYQKNFLEKK